MAWPCQCGAQPQSWRAGEGWGSGSLGCPGSLGNMEDEVVKISWVRSTREKEEVGNFIGSFVDLLGLWLQMFP